LISLWDGKENFKFVKLGMDWENLTKRRGRFVKCGELGLGDDNEKRECSAK